MDTVNQECKGYIILIEWDGAKPPTRWYTTLGRYGLKISGNKDTSPLTRRASSRGVVFQEGTIIVNSDSLARTLASDARFMGAKTVMIGNIDAKNFQMSEQDRHTLENITAVTSKRGPKNKTEEGRYIIHCYEEAKTHVVDLREAPVVCPECGSLRIQWRKGDPRKVAIFNPQVHDLFTYWLSTRFTTKGRFEIPMTYSNSKMPPMPVTDDFEQGIQNAITQVTHFTAKNAETIDGDGKAILRAMDVAYCLQQVDDEARLNRRINALRQYYQQPGNNKTYPFAVDPLAVDMIDVAGADDLFGKYL